MIRAALLWALPVLAQTATQPLTSADYAARAVEHLASGQAQLAVDDYSQAIRLRLDDAGAWTGRGRAYSQLGHYSAAIDDLDQAIRLDPEPALWLVERGYAYGRIGDFERAIQDFDRALDRDPANILALSLRGTAYSVTGQNDRALADREQVVKLTPNLAEAYVARAGSYHALGRHEKGFSDQSKAIEIQPDYEMAWAARGAAYLALRRAREAIGDLEQALKLKPDDSEADKLLAQARAVEALARKPATSPVTPQPPAPEVVIAAPVLNSPAPPEPLKHDSAALHKQRGRELTKLGRYREAIIELSAAIEADPTFALVYNARGFAYHMVRDYSCAVADFDKAIELSPATKTPSITAPPPGRRLGVKER